jgi:hypothetical protein
MTTSITLSYQDWCMLGRLHLEAFKCQRTAVDAIWLSTDHRGELVASVEAPDFSVAVRLGTPGPGVSCQPLTIRTLLFIEYGAVRGDDITVRFDEDGTSTVSLEGTTLSIDRPDSALVAPNVSVLPFEGIAQLDAGSLTNVMTTIDWAPAGVPGPAIQHPAMWLSCLETGELVFSRDWSDHGYGRTTARTSATLTDRFTGPVHVLTELPYVITALLHAIGESDEVVAVDLDADGGGSMRFGTSRWSFRVRTAKSASESLMTEVAEQLAFLNHTYERLDAATVVVGEYPNLVRVAASGQVAAKTRCTQVLVSGVEGGEHLMEELNQINLGLADTKIWLDDGSIVLGIDLENPDAEAVIAAATRLLERAEQLGPALRSFAVSSIS